LDIAEAVGTRDPILTDSVRFYPGNANVITGALMIDGSEVETRDGILSNSQFSWKRGFDSPALRSNEFKRIYSFFEGEQRIPYLNELKH
jgi:hypothetical protein